MNFIRYLFHIFFCSICHQATNCGEFALLVLHVAFSRHNNFQSTINTTKDYKPTRHNIVILQCAIFGTSLFFGRQSITVQDLAGFPDEKVLLPKLPLLRSCLSARHHLTIPPSLRSVIVQSKFLLPLPFISLLTCYVTAQSVNGRDRRQSALATAEGGIHNVAYLGDSLDSTDVIMMMDSSKRNNGSAVKTSGKDNSSSSFKVCFYVSSRSECS